MNGPKTKRCEHDDNSDTYDHAINRVPIRAVVAIGCHMDGTFQTTSSHNVMIQKIVVREIPVPIHTEYVDGVNQGVLL